MVVEPHMTGGDVGQGSTGRRRSGRSLGRWLAPLAALTVTVALAGCSSSPSATPPTATTVPSAAATTTTTAPAASASSLSRCGARDPLDPDLTPPPAGSPGHC
jgi:hypothetical protein